MLFFDLFLITCLAICHYILILWPIKLPETAICFMPFQLTAFESLIAAFFLVFAEEFYLANHFFQYGVDVLVLCIVLMTIWTWIVMLFPTFNTRCAKELILALAALHWLPLYCRHLITNATENQIFDVSYLIRIHYTGIRYYILYNVVH